MSTLMYESGRQLVRKVTLFQTLVALIIAASFTLLSSAQAGVSALIGGFICVLPSLIFALFAFKQVGASKIRQIVRNFSQGSKLKLATTILLFVVAFKWADPLPVPLFSAFMLTTAAQWLLLFNLRTNTKN